MLKSNLNHKQRLRVCILVAYLAKILRLTFPFYVNSEMIEVGYPLYVGSHAEQTQSGILTPHHA